MLRSATIFHFSVLVVIGVLVPIALGEDLPADKLATYAVHEDSSDPNSSVNYEIVLLLHATERDGDSVRWSIAEVEIREKATGGGADIIWLDDDPNVDTTSGQWWVEHVDADAPVNEDFLEPPLIEGVADPQQGTTDTLDFYLEGLVYTPPQGGAPWDATARTGYELQITGESEPLASDPDEPVEVPPVQTEPEEE